MGWLNTVLHGDVLDKIKDIPSESINCCVTSPPYYGLRDYGKDGQIGLEKTPEEYVQKLVSVFREVKRVLRDDGTLWLNLGDSYVNNSNPGGGDPTIGNRNIGNSTYTPTYSPGLKTKNLIGIPWKVAFALQSDGWYLRQDIIWHKPNPMPESVKDRCTKSHEYIFLFSKNEKYYYDNDSIKEPSICGPKGSSFSTGKTGEHQLNRSQRVRPSVDKGFFNAKGEPQPGYLPFRAVTEYRNKRSVWNVSTVPYSGGHFAVFPPKLIEPCILAGCPEKGVVLDPFFGSGTVGEVALMHRRNYVGIELNEEYIKLSKDRTYGVQVNLF